MSSNLADITYASHPDIDHIEAMVTNMDIFAAFFQPAIRQADGKVLVPPERTDVSQNQTIWARPQNWYRHDFHGDKWSVVEGFSVGFPGIERAIDLSRWKEETSNRYLAAAGLPKRRRLTVIPGPPGLRPDQVSLLRSVREVALEASKHDWDGEGADPVERDTLSVALQLVSLFPRVTLPEVTATPHGELDFDWLIRSDVMLTIGVCRHPKDQDRHEIVFIANVEDVEFRGREPWHDEMPPLVNCCFKRMEGWLGGKG